MVKLVAVSKYKAIPTVFDERESEVTTAPRAKVFMTRLKLSLPNVLKHFTQISRN